MSFEVHPLTPGRWDDLAELFSNPIVNWCWCQHYRRSGKAVFGMQDGELVRPSSKEKLKSLVDRDYVHGLIGYEDGRLVGWMSLGPREDYFRLERSPIAKPVDDTCMVDSVLLRRTSIQRQGIRPRTPRGRRRVRPVLRGDAPGGVPGRQGRRSPLQRMVRVEVGVRPRRFQGGRTAKEDAACDAPGDSTARIRTSAVIKRQSAAPNLPQVK